MLDKLKERIMATKAVVGEAIIDTLPNKVPPEIREYRMNTCLDCEHLYKPTSSCKKCGCFMTVKTWMPGQKCPIDKWGKHNDLEK